MTERRKAVPNRRLDTNVEGSIRLAERERHFDLSFLIMGFSNNVTLLETSSINEHICEEDEMRSCSGALLVTSANTAMAPML